MAEKLYAGGFRHARLDVDGPMVETRPNQIIVDIFTFSSFVILLWATHPNLIFCLFGPLCHFSPFSQSFCLGGRRVGRSLLNFAPNDIYYCPAIFWTFFP